ncbi:hypothetical protein H8E88_19340 [candidate division KSB1 bacterium]|nr:hypothetical protein [candidate division KSB1 bacterium]
MGKVYIVQEIMRKNRYQELEPVHDLTPASVYGELKILLSNRRMPLNIQPIIRELRSKLRNFSDEDYLLLVGDPVLIGLATAIAADINIGMINLLKWDRQTKQYIKINTNIRG